jgi:hypothetical protein
MVIAPAKEPWHICRVDVLVDVVFLAQPLRGTRVDRHFGEGTLPVVERTDPAFGGGVAAQRRPPGRYMPTKECADASAQVRVDLSSKPVGLKGQVSATRTDSTLTAATSAARGRLGRPVARKFVGPAGPRLCSPGVRCRTIQTPARAAGQPPRAARLTYRPSTRPTPDPWRAAQARPARPARTACDRRWTHAAAAVAHTGHTSNPPRAVSRCVRSGRERGQPPAAARSC